MPDGASFSSPVEGLDFQADSGFSVISDTVPAGIFVTNVHDGHVVYTNRAFSEILGSSEADVLGQDWEAFFFDHEDREKLMVSFVEEGSVRNRELRLRSARGHAVWVLASMAHIEAGDDDLLLTSFIDVTPLKRAEEEIRQLADQDALTGLPNMRCIRDRLERAVSRARRYDDRVAVLFVDLDGFKAVNDTHGHDAGDMVLKEVADRLKRIIRHCDTVGRLGGDEFILMLTDVRHHDDLLIVAQRAIEALAEPFVTEDWTANIGASIGIASFPENAAEGESLLKLADQAMYGVKKNGQERISDRQLGD